jgi:phage terminase large subunit-like protein
LISQPLSVGGLLEFDAEFELCAHRNQLPPRMEGWRTWLLLAGRGFGKTRAAPNGSSTLRTANRGCGSPLSAGRSRKLAQSQVRLVHALRGKSARAEPIALKFESGTAFFAGEFPDLEAELGGLIAGGGYQGPEDRRTARTRWFEL